MARGISLSAQSKQALIESIARSEFLLNEYHLPTGRCMRENKWSRFCGLFGFNCLTLPTQVHYELFGTWLATVAK